MTATDPIGKLDALTHGITKCLRDSPQTQVVFLALTGHLVDLVDELDRLAEHPGLRDVKRLRDQTEDFRLVIRAALVNNPLSYVH